MASEHQDHADKHDHAHGHEHSTSLLARIRSLFVGHSHDAADSFDTALDSSAAGIRAVKLSLLALLHSIARIDEVQVHVGPLEVNGPQFHSGIEHHRN